MARSLRAGNRWRGAVKGHSIPQAALIIRKGFHKDVDSYSAFTEADGKTTTGLAAYLKARQVKRLFVAGLATDFCVAWTALDARKAGFETYVVEDACRGIDTQGSLAKAWADMAKAARQAVRGPIWPRPASSGSSPPISQLRFCSEGAAAAAFAPPLETPTRAGRSTRSPIM